MLKLKPVTKFAKHYPFLLLALPVLVVMTVLIARKEGYATKPRRLWSRGNRKSWRQ